MTMILSKEEFKILALQLAGWPKTTIDRTCEKTNNGHMKDFCYVGPKTIVDVFEDIQDPLLGEFAIQKPNPAHLIHALYFLKKYPTSHEFAARVQDGTEKTVMSRAWRYIRAIQALKEQKIRWIFDDDNEQYDELFLVSVDGVHCRVFEPRTQPSSGWYSKKSNGAGLTYKIAVAIHHNKIVWINGPFPAGQNNMKVF